MQDNQQPMDDVCELPNSCHLYRKKNEVGGHTYYSDEVGGGVFVWDTCLVSENTLLAAIVEEAKFQYRECVARQRAEIASQTRPKH